MLIQMAAKKSRVLFIGFLSALLAAVIIFVYFTVILNPPQAPAEYKAAIQPKPTDFSTLEGGRTQIFLRIKNLGTKTWRTSGKNLCLVSYHLYDQKRTLIQYENRRFPLPQSLKPRATLEMEITLRSPLKADTYILEFDLLREGVAWFKDHGSKTSEITLQVKERKWPDSDLEIGLEHGKYSLIESSVPEINTLLKLIRLTLEVNEVEFEGKLGKIRGFSAGKTYPQIWLRDANTIIPASRYFYDLSYLSSWIEEHLAHQREEGALYDWINSKGESDKNTTETDQESSAVQAAYQVFELTGTSWLEKKINGKQIVNRLEQSLEYILNNRYNQQYGLLTGAHTADWGDVDMVDADQQAIYLDERTHWTTDIYDQGMFYQACLNLIEMLRACGKIDEAGAWLKRAASIRTNTNGLLWQPGKGFYRVHLHLDSLKHDFDEDDMFAMGGNTAAILSGLANEPKINNIIQNSLERQSTYGISTISGVLLPPYPAGMFAHPLMDEPYEYQNGSQWDWFGGRLVFAMFENGFSHIAREKLLEIIQKNISNRGFFEWDDPEGTGRGSDLFCGSAGVLSQALIQGYLGIKLERDSLIIEPKLGQDSVKVHLYQPANGLYVAYTYLYGQNKTTFRYNTNVSENGIVKILCPVPSYQSVEDLRRRLTVTVDGKAMSPLIESVNQDMFIILGSDLQNRVVEISWDTS